MINDGRRCGMNDELRIACFVIPTIGEILK